MSSQLPAVVVPAFIPSPSQGVWHLGPLPLRAYAICILIGIFAGYWLGRKRWVARGGTPEVLADIIMWAVPFGLVGARIYHVITDNELYFGEGKHPIDALKIWHGGLGIWGAVGFGLLGAWIACRRHKVPFLAVADVMAPGVALAQVVGRFGNYFNQELFGKPTTHFWGLKIDSGHRPEGYADFATFHPTFLYEAIWNLGVVALVILVDKRFKLGHGRAFALYVAGYTAGRAWVENLRIDTVNHFLGLRLNVWTALILFVLSVAYLVITSRTKPGQESVVTAPATPEGDEPVEAAEGEKAADGGEDEAADNDVPAAASDDGDKAKVGAVPADESATSSSAASATSSSAAAEPEPPAVPAEPADESPRPPVKDNPSTPDADRD
ncbi:prolipoprotein diacylglyceryl transferase [Kribbella qitaiheensis]|uniref:Phosphatidylglycerol--prolipoprotein diacylglyceryl transferase n=1 Tax=Kribbella qitaiheensis TaxID=1544730 RepID=A0A7G6X7S3_9ACTN|nr:prolipoprotein diacylglyceryl transferase [Kribbella qitaiheensis]QNE22288.1 prolipoprotein diacylglyceryl transferase [Kribbella qitaiheensis]